MKKIYFLLSIFMIACLLITGCSNSNNTRALSSNPAEELAPIDTSKWISYSDKAGSFSLEFSNQWVQQDTLAAQSIFLDYPDLTAAVKFQRYNKDILAMQNITTMEGFIELHHQASIGALLSIADDLTNVPPENLGKEVAQAQTFSYSIEDKTREKAEEEIEDNQINCYLAYLETPAAYYSCFISAPASIYNSYIHIWSTITSTLSEHEYSLEEYENSLQNQDNESKSNIESENETAEKSESDNN